MSHRYNQDQKVYEWEDRYICDRYFDPKLTLPECYELVNIIWRDCYPDEIPPLVIGVHGRCDAQANEARIWLPRWSRITPIVLHETAHSLIAYEYGGDVEGHGPEFVRTYIELLRRYDDANLTSIYLEQTARSSGIAIANATKVHHL